MNLSLSLVQVAGLVLAALPHLDQHGLSGPSASEAIAALGASRSAAYAARHQLEEGLSELFRRPGRPLKEQVQDPVPDEVSSAVVRFLMDHPGCVTGSSTRRSYTEAYQGFVLELHNAHDALGLEGFAMRVGVPVPTLKDWLRRACPTAEPADEPHVAKSVGPTVAHVETVLAAWRSWSGKFHPFCHHIRHHHRLTLSRKHISDVLSAHGIRIPKRRGRAPDAAALRGGVEAFFSGAQWVGDGTELTVQVDGMPYTVNLELNVDIASGAFVGASVRPTEDAAAVVEALHDGVVTTGSPPLALTLDNKPSNHAAEVEAALGDATVKLRPRPYTPTDKAHVEGAFGLFKQCAPDLVVATEPTTLAAQVAALVFIVWARATNHRPRLDRDKHSRVELYQGSQPSDEQIAAAKARFAERLAQQKKAQEIRRRKQDPVARAALDHAFGRLGLQDDEGTLRAAIACWPLDAVLAGIAIFEGKRSLGTLPKGVDGRYLRGIVMNLATEAESMAIANALLDERLRARDHALRNLQTDRERIEADTDQDLEERVKRYVARATHADRELDRLWWLRATADIATDRPDLLRLAARHISATHAMSAKARQRAIRFLFAKAVPVA